MSKSTFLLKNTYNYTFNVSSSFFFFNFFNIYKIYKILNTFIFKNFFIYNNILLYLNDTVIQINKEKSSRYFYKVFINLFTFNSFFNYIFNFYFTSFYFTYIFNKVFLLPGKKKNIKLKLNNMGFLVNFFFKKIFNRFLF